MDKKPHKWSDGEIALLHISSIIGIALLFGILNDVNKYITPIIFILFCFTGGTIAMLNLFDDNKYKIRDLINKTKQHVTKFFRKGNRI